ncbi:MAG: chemotaxis-specific protein-glutamate methyltransferase CheB [Polyangia bacterium]
MSEKRLLKVLVIDDSAYNRRAVAGFFEDAPGIEVVGKARDGQEGLQLALTEKPDVVTLDLEMPRMDGFSFLRLLMSRQPTPVIVISSYGSRENVFRALELGAIDFVAKPTKRISPEIQGIREEVVRKVQMVRQMRADSLTPLLFPDNGRPETGRWTAVQPPPTARATDERDAADRIVVIAASTGGPKSLTRVLSALPADLEAGIAVVQHMPSSFTATFAERLDRQCALRVIELCSSDILRRGTVYIAPGDLCIELAPARRGSLALKILEPASGDRYVPSADRLFISAASCARQNVLAVVLTGMGDDGSAGVEAVAAAGGLAVSESEQTAVISGMPLAALNTGAVSRVEPLDRMADVIKAFAKV